MRRGTIGEVQDGLENPQRGLELVGGPSGRSKMGRGKLRLVRDSSAVPLGGPDGSWTLREVRDGLGDHRLGLGLVEGSSGRSETGQGKLVEARNS